jgi:alkylhydroperoxidase family enzyme
MAARELASSFCQANILKYGSRYGSKDGKEKKDLMKVIHYAMLLLHFDEHYGKPPITSGNIDHTMP